MDSDLNDWALLRRCDSQEEVLTSILVLSAAEIAHNIEIEQSSFLLYVPQFQQHKADYELACYRDENLNWPPPQPAADTFQPQFLPFSIMLMGFLAVFYMVTVPWNKESIWFISGAGNSELILHQLQWFRLITPLTLHADFVHLTGNCVIGGILLHFLCKTTGNGMALLLTLLTGILANFVNVFLHGSGHIFVGFSTSVFSIIGLMTALQTHIYFKNKQSPLRIFTPFMAGLALLALFGSSGERTDLGAHLFGLLCGGLVGLFFNDLIIKLRTRISVQLFSLLFSALILITAWTIALQTG